MEEIIIALLKQRHQKTAGHNGYSIVQLMQLTGFTNDQVAGVLNKLYKEKKIKVNNSVNHKIARWRFTAKTLSGD